MIKCSYFKQDNFKMMGHFFWLTLYVVHNALNGHYTFERNTQNLIYISSNFTLLIYHNAYNLFFIDNCIIRQYFYLFSTYVVYFVVL